MSVVGVSPPPRESVVHGHLEARRLLQLAQGMRQKWPEGCRGFAAAMRCRGGRETVEGMVRVLTGGYVEVDVRHAELGAWATAELRGVARAFTARFFKDEDGRFPVTFETADGDPRDRSVRVHVGEAAWRIYRIDVKGRICHEEHTAPTKRVMATFDGFVRTCPGRVLPTRTQCLEWDVRTQTATVTADIEDAYACLDHVWLPVCRRTTLADGAGRSERALELSGHVLL